jgi:hypothetical protein
MDGYLVLQEYAGPYSDPTRLNVVDWEATSASVLEPPSRCRISDSRPSQTIVGLAGQEGTGNQMTLVLVRALDKDRRAADWQWADRPLMDLAGWDSRMLYSMHG